MLINSPFVYISPVEKISTYIRQFEAINNVAKIELIPYLL